MSILRRGALPLRARGGAATTFNSTSFQYGRSPAYRRIGNQDGLSDLWTRQPQLSSHIASAELHTLLLKSRCLPASLSSVFTPAKRHIHIRTPLFQERVSKEEVKDPPRQDRPSSASAKNSTFADSSQDPRPESKENTSGKSQEQQQDHQEREQQRDGDQKQEHKKEEPPPPPPHGDKSPWQVFMETLQSEFKASKEWNEGTKAIGSAAQDFTENETIKRMRAGYGTASGAASSSGARALKNTGSAIGKGAAWTWDTMPVRGVRVGVNATGRGMEKLTRPLRETEAFKSMSDVIDDGSSSRYGGWTEKEERRRKRESRELKEAAGTGRPRRAEKAEEDPE